MKASTAAPGAAGMLRMGVVKKITARHWGDGGPLPLEIQVHTYEISAEMLCLHCCLLHWDTARTSTLIVSSGEAQ